MNAHLEEGKEHFNRKEYARARECLERALEDSACAGECCFELGKVFKAEGEYGRAAEMFDKGAAAGFSGSGLRRERGEANFLLGRFDRAMEDFREALKADPSDAWACGRLGSLHRLRGEPEAAEAFFRRALAGGAEAPEVHEGLGAIALQRKDLKGAGEHFEKLLALRPADADTARLLRGVYRERGETEKAEALEAAYPGLEKKTGEGCPCGSGETAPAPEARQQSVPAASRPSAGQDDLFLRNEALNRRETRERKTVLESRPLKLGVSLTERCNLRCRMCSVKNTKKQDIPEHTVAEIIALFPYLKYVQWLGGEAFLSEHFAELFDRASFHAHLRQSINTNGLLITGEWAEQLVRNGVKLDLSVDGLSPGTYERIRLGGKFSLLAERLETLREYRERSRPGDGREITVSMNFAVMRSNLHEVEQLVDFARRYSIDIVQLSHLNEVTPPEVLKEESIEDDPEAAAYLSRVLPEIAAQARACGVTLYDRLLLPGRKAAGAPRRAPEAADGPFCREPWHGLFIMPGPFGAVRPDCLCLRDAGDITAASLEEIWNGPAMQEYRRTLGGGSHRGFCSRLCVEGERPENFI